MNEAYSELVFISSEEWCKLGEDLVAVDELTVRFIDRRKAVVQRSDGGHYNEGNKRLINEDLRVATRSTSNAMYFP